MYNGAGEIRQERGEQKPPVLGMWELVLDEVRPPAVRGLLLPWPGWHPVQGECREELIYGNRRTDLA